MNGTSAPDASTTVISTPHTVPMKVNGIGSRVAEASGEKAGRALGAVPGSGDTRMLVSADGTQIYANAVGDPSKQAVVFIHGFVWSFIAFDDIFDDTEWTTRLYLVRYDARGHGRSGKPDTDEAWESKRFAEDFDTVVKAYELHRPFVVGWSLGSSHLMDILSFHPIEYVAGIINIAGATFIDDTLLDQLATPKGREYINRMAVLPNVEDFQTGAADFIDGCCRTLSYEMRQMCLGIIMTQPRAAMIRSLTRKQKAETFGAVGKTMLPCLLIYGDKDELVEVERLPERYKEWRNVTVEAIEGGSHIPWCKADERVAALFNQKIWRWIDFVMESQM